MSEKKVFYDVNVLKLAGNVVRVNGVYATKNHKQFAFLTIGSHAGSHTTYAEAIAWGDLAKQVCQFKKGMKVVMRAHLGNGFDTTKHGDRVQTLMPVINKIKAVNFKKSSHKQADKNSNSKSKSASK